MTAKNMAANEVYVTTNLDDGRLWSTELTLGDVHWINGESSIDEAIAKGTLEVRTRYRALLVSVSLIQKSDDTPLGNWQLELADEVRAITPGQSAVLYSGDQCLGGGIVI